MRRCPHPILIGVLAVSMSTNAARACWYLRHGCRARQHVVIAHPAPTFGSIDSSVGASCGGWSTPSVSECGGWQVVPDMAEVESIEVGLASCDCGGIVVASEAELVVEDEGSGGSSPVMEPAVDHLAVNERTVVDASGITEPIAAPQPTLAEPADAAPAPKPTDEVRQAAAIGEPATKSEPVELVPATPSADSGPAVVTDAMPPMEEDVPDVELPDAAPPVPVAPAETNIFEEVDEAAAETIAPQPAETPAEDLPATDSAPVGESDVPGDPFDAASVSPREPARRWIDDSGDYAVVGRLRAVRGDGMCVLETDGRTIEVPLAALSDFDRTYARNAAGRLAVDRAPESNDTAGL